MVVPYRDRPLSFFVFLFYTLGEMKNLPVLLILSFLLVACSSGEGGGGSATFLADPLANKLSYSNPVTNYGIAGFGRANIEFQFQKMREIGLQIVRREITWAAVEPVRGEFDFRWFDDVVDMALDYGLKYLGILAYGNKWASREGESLPDDQGDFYPPDDPGDFANYVYTTVQHYRGRIKMWEIWNEPNGGYRFWKSSLVGDPEGYGNLLKVAYEAVKRACPECIVSYGGLFYHQEVIMGAPLYLEKSLEYNPDLGNYFDVFAYHPYPFYPPMAPPESDGFLETPIYDMSYNLTSILEMHGISKPLWITEIGWPTIYSLSETDQARYLVRSFVLAYATGASMYLYFTFWDSDITRAIVPPEAKFGLYDYPYGVTDFESLAKPAWFAYANVIRLLGNSRFFGECDDMVKFDPLSQFALEFTRGDERICVVWQRSGNSKLVLKERPDAILSMYGEEIADNPMVSPSPVFLIRK